jgi:hypothetical protein
MPDQYPGIRPPNYSKKAGTSRFWLLLLSICFSLWIAINLDNSLRSWQEGSRLSERGILVSGVITGRRNEYSFTEASSSHYISYRFPVARPNITNHYSREELVDYDTWNALDGVRFVNIQYLPENPRVSRLEITGLMPLKNARNLMVVVILSALLAFGLLALVSCAAG